MSYKYDLRDRCSYWCWLDHITSLCCYFLYAVLLGFNIFYAYRTNSYLKKSYRNLLDKSIVLIENHDSTNNVNDSNSRGSQTIEGKNYISNEDKDRIEKLRIMKLKCMIYPIITSIIWSLSTVYRIIDDIAMMSVDNFTKDQDNKTEEEEKDLLNNNLFLKVLVQTFLVFHTFLSAFRGLLYGFCFIIFEKNIFGDILQNFVCKYLCFCGCCKNKDLYGLEDNLVKTNDRESSEGDVDARNSNASDLGKNNEMNTSDYRYND